MEHTYSELKERLPFIDWDGKAPLIAKINELKKERNAIILCHNYQTPDIYYGVADGFNKSSQ